MAIVSSSFEKHFFRRLNSVVEPAVRRGVLSPRCAPAGLIILDTIGFKSGEKRSTPLLATRLGKYTFISTVRTKRSFWLRNLQKTPAVDFHVGGKQKHATSFVFTNTSTPPDTAALPKVIANIASTLVRKSKNQVAIAILKTEY